MKEKIQYESNNPVMYGYVIALAIVMPWSNALFNMLLVSGILLFIIEAIRGNFEFSKSFISIPIFISMLSFFIICLLSIALRKDWDGLGYLNRVAVFTVLPFLVFNISGKLTKKSALKVILFYIHSTAILSLSTLLTAMGRWMVDYGDGEIPFGKGIVYENLSNSLVHHQPIYFAIFVGFALIGLVYIILSERKKNRFQIWIYITEAIFLLFFLFLLGSRTAILATFISLFVLCLVKSKKIFLLVAIVSVILFSLNYSYNKSFKTRIDHVLDFNTDFDYHSDWSYEGLALRYMTWNCSISCIRQTPWIGSGITESQNCLNACYRDKNYHSLLYFAKHHGKTYNSHNLFLDVFLKLGFFGLLVIATTLLLLFLQAIKTRNMLLILLLIFFCINGMTESILVREKGIIFFCFMLGFLSSLNLKDEVLMNRKSPI